MDYGSRGDKGAAIAEIGAERDELRFREQLLRQRVLSYLAVRIPPIEALVSAGLLIDDGIGGDVAVLQHNSEHHSSGK